VTLIVFFTEALGAHEAVPAKLTCTTTWPLIWIMKL